MKVFEVLGCMILTIGFVCLNFFEFIHEIMCYMIKNIPLSLLCLNLIFVVNNVGI